MLFRRKDNRATQRAIGTHLIQFNISISDLIVSGILIVCIVFEAWD